MQRKTNNNNNSNNNQTTQLRLSFQFVLEKGDETENFLRKRPDGNLSIDCLSNFTHTFWFIMVKWTKKAGIDNTWISEATRQNLYRNSLLASTLSKWLDSSSICLWEETVTHLADICQGFKCTPSYHTLVLSCHSHNCNF